jgi:RecB family exonuclease
LRLPNRETNQQKHLTFAESLELIYSCGTLGGLAGRPESAREWIVALHKREEALKASLEEQRRIAAEDPEESVHARGLEDNQRLFENLQAIRPALAELVKVHDILLNDGSLSFLWAAIERFMLDWVLLPPCSTPVLPILINEMEPLLLLSEVGAGGKPEETYKMTGLPALRMIRKTLDRIRVRVGQFGEPRIYIGTIEGAVGLTFDAARIIGLCEGAWPSRPPVDSILPDIDRIYLEPSYGQSNGQDSQDKNDEQIIPRRDDRPLYQLCAFYRVIQGVRTRIVLSFARQSVDGTIKEPSSIYLEVATALRRSVCGKPASSVPSLKDLRLGYFIPAREAGLSPPALSDFTTCRQVAGRTTPTDALVPYTWKSPSGMSTDIFRMRELILYARSGIIGPQDGILPPEWPLPRLLGLENQSPLSASRIKRFLTCPYWFFLQDMLHWKEPPSAPLTREVGQPAYGNLLHRVAEAFFKQYGVEFTSRRRSLAEWKKEAVAVIDREFDLFLNEYPLLSGLVRDQERKRLARDFRRLIEYEWHERKELRFRKAEFRYGYPEPLFLDLDGRKFFVRGFIDRLDDAGGRILVRDIKSGKGRPREGKDKSPDPVLDVQLALYGLVMDAIHKIDPANWPEVGGVAYFYLDPRGASERTFEEDLYDLLEKGRIWLSTLADMIKAHIFPRTVISNDCTYCPFVPVCGDQANGAAAEKLQDAGDILKKYLSLKMKEESEAEEIEL